MPSGYYSGVILAASLTGMSIGLAFYLFYKYSKDEAENSSQRHNKGREEKRAGSFAGPTPEVKSETAAGEQKSTPLGGVAQSSEAGETFRSKQGDKAAWCNNEIPQGKLSLSFHFQIQIHTTGARGLRSFWTALFSDCWRLMINNT